MCLGSCDPSYPKKMVENMENINKEIESVLNLLGEESSLQALSLDGTTLYGWFHYTPEGGVSGLYCYKLGVLDALAKAEKKNRGS
jgi:hypothetical protein